jgi:hypothetical protein
MALKPENPVVGGEVLRRAAIQSPNFVTGLSGWTINQDGSAEFNNLTVRGTTFLGTNFVIGAAGEFFYSGTPAAGNLVASVTNAAGTDQYGNIYLANISSYGAGFASSLGGGFSTLYTGSLAGGWTPQATIETGIGGGLFLTAALGITLADAATADAGLTVTGGLITDTLTVNGSASTGVPSNNSTSTNGLPNGGIQGNSGAASAGTAHTHGPGGYSVVNGQHSHNLNSHTHPL